jgi:hypothetical protein
MEQEKLNNGNDGMAENQPVNTVNREELRQRVNEGFENIITELKEGRKRGLVAVAILILVLACLLIAEYDLTIIYIIAILVGIPLLLWFINGRIISKMESATTTQQKQKAISSYRNYMLIITCFIVGAAFGLAGLFIDDYVHDGTFNFTRVFMILILLYMAGPVYKPVRSKAKQLEEDLKQLAEMEK